MGWQELMADFVGEIVNSGTPMYDIEKHITCI